MTGRPRIVIPGDYPPQIGASPCLADLRSLGEVTVYPDLPSDDRDQCARVRDATIILNSRGTVQWTEPLLRPLSSLRFITTCSIGTDMIDLDAARALGIVVSNQPGRTAAVVAEHMFGLMFALGKRVVEQTAAMRRGEWQPVENIFFQGKTLGIIGTGHIGKEMARLGRALGMSVLAWTYHPDHEWAVAAGVRYCDWETLLRESDVVSVHVRLSPDSQDLLDAAAFALMKQSALFLNGARGGVVSTPALVTALQEGHIAGAALDVYDQEPLPLTHPLLTCENIVLTPHAADQTPEGREMLNQGAVENIRAYLAGRPIHVVT